MAAKTKRGVNLNRKVRNRKIEEWSEFSKKKQQKKNLRSTIDEYSILAIYNE